MFELTINPPFHSRRYGRCLDINLLGPQKLCSFDCPYCNLGPSVQRLNLIKKGELQLPTKAEVLDQFRIKTLEYRGTFDHVILSGNGEPTLHPEFAEIVTDLALIKRELEIKGKFLLLSNGAHFENKNIVTAANLFDERVIKLDAGNDRTLKKVNQPLVRANVNKIYTNMRKLKDVIIQSFFVTGSADNTSNEAIEDWMEVIGIIKPKLVQICTINQTPALSSVLPASEDTLYTIASKLKRRIQIESNVFL